MEGGTAHRVRVEDPQFLEEGNGDSPWATVTIGSTRDRARPPPGPSAARAAQRRGGGQDSPCPVDAHREDCLPIGVPPTPIVFVVPERLPVPPVLGGAVERWVHEVSQRLRAAGHPVTVVSRPAEPPPPDDGIERLAASWVPWARRLEAWRQRAPQRHPLRALAKVALVADYAWRVRQALQGRDHAVLYVHNDPLLAWLLGRRPRGRIVLHLHNDHLTHPLLRPLAAALLPRVHKVLFVSAYLRGRAAARFADHAPRFVTVANGTDPLRFRPRCTGLAEQATTQGPSGRLRRAGGPGHAVEGAITFVYAGRLTPDKGVHVLLRAFEQVRRSLPRSRLLVAGSSFFAGAPVTPYERQLRELAAPLADAVHFAGFLSPAELAQMYAHADAVVVPSIWAEPSGLVVLEAMACGTCVLASRVGGIPELVDDGRTGLLVPPERPDALAQAMLRVAGDAPLRERLGHAARQAVLQHHTWARVASDVARELLT